MPTYRRDWNSLSDFVDYCSGECDLPAWERASRREGEFYGTPDYATAEALAFNWPEGVAKVETIRARISAKGARVRKQAVAREVGPGVVSMGRFVAGHPQPYIALEDSDRVKPGKGKVVHVMLNCSVSSAVSLDVIETRGAATLALCAALEHAGRRVEISVINCADYTPRGSSRVHRYDYRVTIKRPERRLNLNSVVFSMVHPSFLRRFMFSAKERESGRRKGSKVNLGSPAQPESLPRDCVYVSGAHIRAGHFNSEEAAAAWVNSVLEDQGVKIH